MGDKIGDVVMYDKKVLRTTSCWRCKYRGEYEWRESGYPYGLGEKIPHSKKMFCKKTRRWGQQNERVFAQSLRATAIVMSTPP